MSESSIIHRQSSIAGLRTPTTGYRLPAAAFTLVELLVALALVGTIVTMVYGSYAAATRSLERYGSRMAAGERAILVLRLMARQIRGAYLPPAAEITVPVPGTAQGDEPWSAAPPTAPAPRAGAAPPATWRAEAHAGGLTLCFVTTSGPGPGPDSPAPLSQVQYRYEPVPGTLSLHCEPYLGAPAPTDRPAGRTILGGVRHLEVQFYDGRRWQARWDSSSPSLPQAVKIDLTVVDNRRRPQTFGTIVPILGQTIAPQESSRTGTP